MSAAARAEVVTACRAEAAPVVAMTSDELRFCGDACADVVMLGKIDKLTAERPMKAGDAVGVVCARGW